MRTSTRRKFPFCFVVTWCLSHASTTTPGRLTRARELDTDVRFSLFDRNADGRLGGDEVVRFSPWKLITFREEGNPILTHERTH